MVELKNEFSWSVTRQNRFETCKRQYYYFHYGMWNGWDRNAPKEIRKCYILSKMLNLHMLAGQIVHDLIKDIFENLKRNNCLPEEQIIEEGRNRLNQAWRQSKKKLWLNDPKRNCNLFEHYYNKTISDDFIQNIRYKVINGLQNFYKSQVFGTIRKVPANQWKPIEDFQKFKINNYSIGLKIDFALDRNGFLEIYDWKTGREEESNIEQLACYALYGQRLLSYDADRIILYLFYLNENKLEKHTVTNKQNLETEQQIIRKCEEMLSFLDDKINNEAHKENFLMLSNKNVCKQCFFQEICFGGPI